GDVLDCHVLAHRAQAGEDLPGAVDEVDPPATPPAAGRVLLRTDVGDGATHDGVRRGETAMTKAFQHPAGDVGATGVLHRVVVGEGDLFQQRAVLGLVERGPAAVVVLHRQ